MITQSQLKKYLEYNPETGLFTRLVSTSNSAVKGDIAGYVDTGKKSGYIKIRVMGYQYLAHRLAWLYMTGVWPDKVDHEDHNRRNNKWLNLRNTTDNEGVHNGMNRSRYTNNKSGCMGVNSDSKSDRWRVRIQVGASRINLGAYLEWWDAVCARKSADFKYKFHHNHGKMT